MLRAVIRGDPLHCRQDHVSRSICGLFGSSALKGYAQALRLSAVDKLPTQPLAPARQRLNARCAEQGVALQFTGLGSAMNAHFVAGPVHDIHAIAGVDTCLRGLLFHALLDSGFYIAARGLIALSMPLQDSDLDAFSDAVAACVDRYRSVLPAA